MFPNELHFVQQAAVVLHECPLSVDTYQNLLEQLGRIVSNTAQDGLYRDRLALDNQLWQILKDAVTISPNLPKPLDLEVSTWYVRTLRAVVLLLRNLSVSEQNIPEQLNINDLLVERFVSLTMTAMVPHTDMHVPLYVVSLQFLHNISRSSTTIDVSVRSSLMQFLQYPLSAKIAFNKDWLLPYCLYISNMSTNLEFLSYFIDSLETIDILQDIFLTRFISDNKAIFKHNTEVVENNGHEIQELSEIDTIILKGVSHIATSQEFMYYLMNLKHKNTRTFHNTLRLLQLLYTGSNTWTEAQLSSIMKWWFELFAQISNNIREYFNKNRDDEREAEPLHFELDVCLDIMAHLCKFEQVQQLFLNGHHLKTLVSLLQTLQDNLIKVNFQKDKIKTTTNAGSKIENSSLTQSRIDYTNHHIKSTNFPECKSLIIEILAMLTIENREVQDQIRELHGLELILSNCLVDDNDPFIKERSIACIKFLLMNNEDNQSFVAQLEAKNVVQDETISEAGYEVEVDINGKLGLVSNEKYDKT